MAEKDEAFERFEELTKRLVAVPKEDIDKERQKKGTKSSPSQDQPERQEATHPK